jgi:hypothetical protein
MSTPVPGPLSVTPLYAAGAGDELVSWDDANATWRQVAIPPGAVGATGPAGPVGPKGDPGTGASGTLNALMVGNGAGQPLVSSVITSDNGTTLRVSTNAVVGNAVASPPAHALVINANAAAPQPAVGSVPQLWLASSDGGDAVALLDRYGAGGIGLNQRLARGTAAVPSAVQSGDVFMGLNGGGRGATAYTPFSVQIGGQATENWTDTAHGSQIYLATTANGAASGTVRAFLAQALMLTNGAGALPAGGDTGPGSINVAGGGYYINGQNIVSGGGFATSSNVTYGAVTSQTNVMFGANCTFVPRTGGRVLVTMVGRWQNNVAGNTTGLITQLAWGTGAAPAQGAASSGNLIGIGDFYTLPGTTAAPGFTIPFTCLAYINPGTLTPGTSYWVDLVVSVSAASMSANMGNCLLSAAEL